MGQFRKYTLSALVAAALLNATGFAVAAEPTVQTRATSVAPHVMAATTATVATTTPATPTVADIVNQQALVTTPKNIQDVRPFIFSDVPSDFWASRSISGVTKAKLMNGYSDGTFRPNQAMTREEVASLFNNLTDDGEAAFLSSKFKDITSDRWSALAIASVSRKNIISGYGDDTYQPEKYMSRQEFAVVADNYIHYLGYTTEDPTVLDSIAYGDQKYIAPWAQDAVRELAYLGFTSYAPGTMFNPEKYITRAEAAEVAFRMTQTPQALAFHNALYRQEVENKTSAIIDRTLNYGNDFSKFRNEGALFWDESKLHVTAVDKKDVKALTDAFTNARDPQLDATILVSQGKLTQAQLEEYQANAVSLYKNSEPTGNILAIKPSADTSTLILTVSAMNDATVKAFKKEFGQKVVLQLPPEETTTTIQFPLPAKQK